MRSSARLLTLISSVATALLFSVTAADTSEGCTKVASPVGSDLGAGSEESPYRTVQRLVDSLAAGQVGCLRGGEYGEGEVTLASPDTRLTSYPGERARLLGRLRVSADRVTVDRLELDGRNWLNLPSPTINADDVVFRDNDVSSGGICFLLGGTTEVRRPVIEGNRIHDCGEPLSVYHHGIYMQDVESARIVANTIYDNASRGIKVGPDAQRSLIRGNVIDGNAIGLNFSGNGEQASSDNVVEYNVIANSTRWWNVQSYWPLDSVGANNELRHNCVYGSNPDPRYNSNGGVSDGDGFNSYDNLVAEPRYRDRPNKDFQLTADSPCRPF